MSNEHRASPPGGREGRAKGAAQDLLRRAEQEARKLGTEDPAALSLDEIRHLLHELRVHQIELEMQNEELRRAQVALDAMRARYFDLYDLAPVGYVALDGKGLITEANLRASAILGTPRGRLVSQPLSRFIAAEDQDTYYRLNKALLEAGEPQVCELRLKQQNGAQPWVRLEATAALDERSGETGCWAAMSDITEMRATQEKLAQADRVAAVGVLAAGVAHEINNPLTYVLYNVETLAEDLSLLTEAVGSCREALRERVGSEALAEIAGAGARMLDPPALAELAERVGQAVEGSHRIKAIAKGLGFFSRVERSDKVLVDLTQAAEHAVSLLSNELKCRAAVVKDLRRVPKILASDGKLAQVFLNLLLNAAHSIDEGAVSDNRITLRTWADTDHVYAEVTDTGRGVPPQDREKLFEPFYTNRGAYEGTGLGLAIARQIVTELGGDIQLDSTVAKGTRFVVRFPFGEADTETSSPTKTTPPGVRGRILVVDDEKTVRATITRMLGRDHDVVTVGSGSQAKELVATDPRFDLVLCDLMMPDCPGIDLHAWLTERHPTLARRLVFITGGVFTPRTQEYLDRAAVRVFEKPFDTARLKRLVGELVAAAHSNGRPV